MRYKKESLFASTILGTAVLSAALTTSAFAQSANEQVAQVAEVVVTGSRIRQPGYRAASPISSVGAEEIALKQPVAVEELLRELPSAVPATGPGTNNGSGGGATINLRGLGTNRTLVLINGRRAVPFNLAGVVDTNTIPVALIERVDVVSGGASAVYGADAVAGVVNFVLKNNFQGVEVNSSYGLSEEGDAVRRKIDVTMGGNFADDRGNAVVSFGYTKTDALSQGSRPWGLIARSSNNGAPQGSGTTVPGRFGTTPLVPGKALPNGAELHPESGGLIGQGDPRYNKAGYNYNPYNLYQTPLSRYQLTGMANYKINSSAEVYTHASYVQSDVSLNNAPTGTFGNTYQVPIGNPFIPAGMRNQICEARGISTENCVPGERGTTIVPLMINRRFTEMGSRPVNIENRTFQIIAGIRGDIGKNWNYDVYASHGETQQQSSLTGWGSLSKLRNALNTVSATTCQPAGSSAPIPGCIPINVFGPEGSITQPMINYVNLSSMSKSTIKQDVISASVSGLLPEQMSSPWAERPIAAAFGVEWRRSSAATRSDASSQIAGEVLGTGAPSPDRQGQFEIREAFTEFSVPLVENRPLIHSLNLEVGYRYTEFETANRKKDYSTYKIGGDWSPIEEVRLRAMYQRATRAPNIGELFNPRVTGLANLAVDPCQGDRINTGQANTAGTLSNLCRLTGVPSPSIGFVAAPNSGQMNILTGGNPGLAPEEADTWTIGAVWTPSAVPNLSLSLDYYDIKLTNTISGYSVNDVIKGCYDKAKNPNFTLNNFCQLIGRSTANGSLNGVEASGIAMTLSNLGNERVSGFDFAANYRIELEDYNFGAVGRVDLAVNGNIVTKNEFQATPASDKRNCVGYYSTSCGEPRLKQRWTTRATWSLGDYAASLQWRYLSGAKVEPGTGQWYAPYSSISAYNYFDLTGRWDITQSVRLTATINNLLDEKPPEVGSNIGTTASNNGNTFPQTYDAIGRYYTVGLRLKF